MKKLSRKLSGIFPPTPHIPLGKSINKKEEEKVSNSSEPAIFFIFWSGFFTGNSLSVNDNCQNFYLTGVYWAKTLHRNAQIGIMANSQQNSMNALKCHKLHRYLHKMCNNLRSVCKVYTTYVDETYNHTVCVKEIAKSYSCV